MLFGTSMYVIFFHCTLFKIKNAFVFQNLIVYDKSY